MCCDCLPDGMGFGPSSKDAFPSSKGQAAVFLDEVTRLVRPSAAHIFLHLLRPVSHFPVLYLSLAVEAPLNSIFIVSHTLVKAGSLSHLPAVRAPPLQKYAAPGTSSLSFWKCNGFLFSLPARVFDANPVEEVTSSLDIGFLTLRPL